MLCDDVSPDGLGKSNRVVTQCEVTGVSIQYGEMSKPAIKSQEVLVLQTHNNVMCHFKAHLTCSKVSLFGSFAQ